MHTMALMRSTLTFMFTMAVVMPIMTVVVLRRLLAMEVRMLHGQ